MDFPKNRSTNDQNSKAGEKQLRMKNEEETQLQGTRNKISKLL